MAARMKAELLGLFVEDINLLRLAGLPFAREVGFPSAISRELDIVAMERALKVVAVQARRAIMNAAERARIRWSFRVARGSVVTELLSAALEADLLVLGKVSRGFRTAQHVGSTALSVVARAPRPVLVLEPGISVRAPVLVVFDGSQAARETLSVAAELSKTCGDDLVVLIATSALESVRQLQKEADEVLTELGVDARYRNVASADVQPLVDAAKVEGAGILVLPRSSRLFENDGFQNLLAGIRCPVFVVR
jgi:nucleotide-binding universal stress UspA family protein